MGLFSIAAEPEKRPIDVIIYDAAAPESAPAPAAEAAPPIPSIEDIPDPRKEPIKETVEPPKDMPKTATVSSAPASSAGANEKPGAAPSDNAGTGSGEGTGRDPGAAQRLAVQPVLISGAAPVYPPELERNGITGTVRVRLVVSADGGVQSVEVTSPSGRSELDQAAIAAAYTYRFEPARNIYDEPVACRINRTFSFS